MQIFRRPTQLLILSLFGVLVILLTIRSTNAETRNALTPDAGVTSPLNTGPNTQQKTGSLIIGAAGGSSQLCLNPNLTSFPGTSDPANCIRAWSQVATAKYVAITTVSLENFAGQDQDVPFATIPANYTDQSGYSDIKAATNSQHVTTAITSSDVNICNVEYANPEASPGHCFGNPAGALCRSNSDCAYDQSGNFSSTAVYGRSNGSPSSYAGYFGGTVVVDKPSLYTSYRFGNRGRICLGSFEPPYAQVPGGTDGCISSWNELTAGPAPYVKVQTANPPANQTYGAAITGSSLFSSVVLGSAAGFPTVDTCGNGICESDELTASSCPIDCSAVPPPTNFTPKPNSAATLANLKIDLPITITTQQPTTAKVLIVRSLNAAPTFQPVNGIDYPPGADLGNNTFVIVNTSTATPFTFNTLSDTLPARGTYYYQAYQANAYPRYSLPTAAMVITPYQLTATVSPANKGTLTSVPAGISCSNSCSTIVNAGTTVRVTLSSTVSGYSLKNWTGNCDQISGAACTVLVNADKNVQANLVAGGGPGGGGGGGRF